MLIAQIWVEQFIPALFAKSRSVRKITATAGKPKAEWAKVEWFPPKYDTKRKICLEILYLYWLETYFVGDYKLSWIYSYQSENANKEIFQVCLG